MFCLVYTDVPSTLQYDPGLEFPLGWATSQCTMAEIALRSTYSTHGGSELINWSYCAISHWSNHWIVGPLVTSQLKTDDMSHWRAGFPKKVLWWFTEEPKQVMLQAYTSGLSMFAQNSGLWLCIWTWCQLVGPLFYVAQKGWGACWGTAPIERRSIHWNQVLCNCIKGYSTW